MQSTGGIERFEGFECNRLVSTVTPGLPVTRPESGRNCLQVCEPHFPSFACLVVLEP
jgi:hypothetical protein